MKNKFNIILLPGDGIGQEISSQAKKILNWIDSKTKINFEVSEDLIGGASYDKYQTPLEDKTLANLKKADAIILGAVGGPKWENLPFEKRPERGLLKIRKELDLFANFRPAIVFDSLIDSLGNNKSSWLKTVNSKLENDRQLGLALLFSNEAPNLKVFKSLKLKILKSQECSK